MHFRKASITPLNERAERKIPEYYSTASYNIKEGKFLHGRRASNNDPLLDKMRTLLETFSEALRGTLLIPKVSALPAYCLSSAVVAFES